MAQLIVTIGTSQIIGQPKLSRFSLDNGAREWLMGLLGTPSQPLRDNKPWEWASGLDPDPRQRLNTTASTIAADIAAHWDAWVAKIGDRDNPLGAELSTLALMARTPDGRTATGSSPMPGAPWARLLLTSGRAGGWSAAASRPCCPWRPSSPSPWVRTSGTFMRPRLI